MLTIAYLKTQYLVVSLARACIELIRAGSRWMLKAQVAGLGTVTVENEAGYPLEIQACDLCLRLNRKLGEVIDGLNDVTGRMNQLSGAPTDADDTDSPVTVDSLIPHLAAGKPGGAAGVHAGLQPGQRTRDVGAGAG